MRLFVWAKGLTLSFGTCQISSFHLLSAPESQPPQYRTMQSSIEDHLRVVRVLYDLKENMNVVNTMSEERMYVPYHIVYHATQSSIEV